MKYRDGFLYQLAEEMVIETDLRPKEDIHTEFIHLYTTGRFCLESGFACDGPSGPIKMIAEKIGLIPFVGKWLKKKYLKTIMTPSFFHDGGYKLIRMEKLPPEWRVKFDDLLVKMCNDRKMNKTRQKWVYAGVRKGAGYAADPDNAKEIFVVE